MNYKTMQLTFDWSLVTYILGKLSTYSFSVLQRILEIKPETSVNNYQSEGRHIPED